MSAPSIDHSHWTVVLLRVGLGWLFTYAGWSKVITFFTAAPDWTARGYLSAVDGPFESFFAPMIGNVWIDYLNAYGLLLIGVTLLFGIFLRWASLWGITLMVLYWLADFPPEHAFIIDDHLIYAFAFLVLATVDAGKTLGVDGYLESTKAVKKHPWLKIFLG